jgi:cobalt-zinc-cadmium efflux system membrane fusion protein
MNVRTENTWRWPVVVFVAIGLIGLGSVATYLVMRSQVPETAGRPGLAVQDPAPDSARPGAVTANASTSSELPSDLSLTLSKEAVDRAGIVASRVSASTAGGRIRVPAVVEPNAYRSVVVTPIAAGRVTSVSAQLGQHVRRGQPLAQVYSPELSETQSRYLAARAELDAHDRELRRTEKLVEIGSASRQELERIHAEHTAAVTMVQSLKSQLTLLGMTSGQVEKLTSPSEITATVAIPAPIEGVITERAANIGLNVDAATKLFTVVDLSTVWVVGNLYERDFAQVRVGSPVTITTAAYPAMMLEGKVSYLDPKLNPDTRTAQLRVEVPNPGSQLRLGMYAEMQVGEASAERVMVPRAAVQVIGDRSVIYLADSTANGRFIEREVRLGSTTGDQVEIVSGVQPGDLVVIKGSFALRAERERLGLRPTGGAGRPIANGGQSIRVTVSEKGFEPARVPLRAGAPARLSFVRTTDATCATEVVIPSLAIKRLLPLNQPVDIEFTPDKPGDIAFACGMGMLSGTLVVQ